MLVITPHTANDATPITADIAGIFAFFFENSTFENDSRMLNAGIETDMILSASVHSSAMSSPKDPLMYRISIICLEQKNRTAATGSDRMKAH